MGKFLAKSHVVRSTFALHDPYLYGDGFVALP